MNAAKKIEPVKNDANVGRSISGFRPASKTPKVSITSEIEVDELEFRGLSMFRGLTLIIIPALILDAGLIALVAHFLR